MLFVEVDVVVIHAASITLASCVLPAFADVLAVGMGYVPPKFPGLPQSGWYVGSKDKRAISLEFLFFVESVL